MHLCHCLISTSYLAGLCEIFILLHIWQNCVCFGQFMVRLCRASQMCLFSRWFHKVLESCEQQPFLNYTQFDWSLWKHSRTQPDPNVASLCSNTRKSHRLNQWHPAGYNRGSVLKFSEISSGNFRFIWLSSQKFNNLRIFCKLSREISLPFGAISKFSELLNDKRPSWASLISVSIVLVSSATRFKISFGGSTEDLGTRKSSCVKWVGLRLSFLLRHESIGGYPGHLCRVAGNSWGRREKRFAKTTVPRCCFIDKLNFKTRRWTLMK